MYEVSINLPTKLAFIGGGRMASSLIGGVLAQGLSAEAVTVADPCADTRARLQAEWGVRTEADNRAALRAADWLVLAVKPQVAAEVVSSLAAEVDLSDKVIVSVMAGVRVAHLQRWLSNEAVAIIRCMPNTPALINLGITGMYANAATLADARAQATALLQAVGQVMWLADEAALDAVTAVSGSGPAYFFRIMEALVGAAQTVGLTAAQARTLTLQTALGAATMACRGETSLAELRQRVTSPGGTTAAGLAALVDADIDHIMAAVVQAAQARSMALADAADASP